MMYHSKVYCYIFTVFNHKDICNTDKANIFMITIFAVKEGDYQHKTVYIFFI